ncbi:MAG: cobalamin biosynthesis protein CbiG, partial [Deltaproteobacteria bacterium]|nr:cobalamin biosynthesis protein CbiG [Deltaproteobacteria bacterium]
MRLAEKIAKALEADLFAPIKHKGDFPQSEPFHKLGETLERNFAQYEGHVIVAATGLVVRLIAPLLDDKSKDPAVVALGQDGRYVISLLSGHLGGANDLARSVAAITGGRAVVTTATDLASVPAMEMLARDLGLIPESLKPLSAISGALVDGERAQLYDPGAFLWPHLSNWPELFERMESDNLRPPAIRVDYRGLARQEGVLVLRPPALALGVGCHKEAKSFEL